MDKSAWLAQVTEEILEPDLPICDPHHHLWDVPAHRYLLHELLADTDTGHNVVSTVFVECASMYRSSATAGFEPVGETEFVNGVAAMFASGNYGPMQGCAAIVSFADLCLGQKVGEVLDAHIAASSRFVGIRHANAWDASDEIRNAHTHPVQHLLEQETFRAGIRELTRRNLTLDCWMFHPQIPELTRLAQAFPDQIFVLDHFGGPLGIGPYANQGERVFTDWKKAITNLARCENVVVKLGGLAMPLNGFGFHKADKPASSRLLHDTLRDYYLVTIDAFGPNRCMFESNFPVDKVSCSYAVLWNAFKRIAAGFSASEKSALFHDTAVRTYKIGD